MLILKNSYFLERLNGMSRWVLEFKPLEERRYKMSKISVDGAMFDPEFAEGEFG